MLIKAILDEKSPEIITVRDTDPVRKAAETFKTEGIGFAVVDNAQGEHIGTVSERDIVQALAKHDNLADLPVAEIMTTNVVEVSPEDTDESVRELMTERRTRHVLVKNGGDLIGVVSIGDLMKHSLDQCQIDTGQMREYISGTGYQ